MILRLVKVEIKFVAHYLVLMELFENIIHHSELMWEQLSASIKMAN